MKILAKPVAILGLAGAMTLMTPALSSAQMMMYGVDTSAYTGTPGPDGMCWIPVDRPYMEFGRGYWGKCPSSAKAPSATQARAQAPKVKAKPKAKKTMPSKQPGY